MDPKVSFTIRRPTPVSRETSSGPESDAALSFKVPKLPRHPASHSRGSPLARSATSSPHPQPRRRGEVIDSSDEENAEEDELITGFDSLGAQRANGERRKNNEPLVIPPLKNKDWRELARKRRSAGQFLPLSASTGKDGSVGGLGTRGTINHGPVLSGLQVKKQVVETISDGGLDKQETTDFEMVALEPETEDQKALRAILAESTGEAIDEGPTIDVIPTPISEADALKQDVVELPDQASLEDYTRVPVSQFGAALLRGMGWKDGAAASRKSGKGLVEPYLPAARPALLGIGAKEQEVYDDGSGKNKKTKRPDKRYIPVVKQERSGTSTPLRDSGRSRSPRRSGAPSRRTSRSPERNETGDRPNGSRRSYQERDERREDKHLRRYDDYRTNRDRERGREDENGQRGENARRREDRERSRERHRD